TRIPAELILTNQSGKPIRLGTFVNGLPSDGLTDKSYKTDLGPDHFFKDSPSPETIKKHIVTLAPGKSVVLPFTVPVPATARGTFTVHAAYSTEPKFGRKYNIWSGRVEAEPVSLKVQKIEQSFDPKGVRASSLDVELAPAAKVTRNDAGR